MAKYICQMNFKDGSKGEDKEGKVFGKSFKKGQVYDGQFADSGVKKGFLKAAPEPKPAPAPAAKK